MRKLAVLLTIVLLAAPAARASVNPDSCDRTGDGVVTTKDAFVALKEAVNTCRRTHFCDTNGDDESTAADALLLLRDAVALPVELQCSCADFDECFEDSDCIDGWPANYHCNYTLCVRCEFDDDCDDGEVCDRCRYECVPAGE